MPSRVIVVSNRLPVTVYPDRPEPDDIELSSGGLVSAFRSLVEEYDHMVWIGWPGASIESEEVRERVAKRLKSASKTFELVPVWLGKEEVDGFYAGFSNSSLWPLLHWMTPYARFKRAWADSYRSVNEKFAEVILQTAERGDLVWIQDYHLFMVPQMIRKRETPGLEEELFREGLIQRPKDLPPQDADEAPDVPQQKRAGDDDDDEGFAMMKMFSGKRPSFLPPDSDDTKQQAVRQEVRFKSVELSQDVAEVLKNLGADDTEDTDVGQDDTPSHRGMPPRRASHRGLPPRSVTSVEMKYKLKIAFFLHTPFPSYEVISVLPQCAEIIEGMLGSDLIGFHTYSYLRHFRSCVIRTCGYTPEMDRVDHLGQRTKLGVFPIGANWQGIQAAMQSDDFKEHLTSYVKQFEGKSLVLSVERLDYSKGLPQKLAAIQRYLEESTKAQKAAKAAAAKDKAKDTDRGESKGDKDSERREDAEQRSSPAARKPGEPRAGAYQERTERLAHLARRMEERPKQTAATKGSLRRIGASLSNLLSRAWNNEPEEPPVDHSQTVFLFIAVPSRQEVAEYKQIEEEVHRTISDINGKFSTPTHQPIVYIHRGISMEELAALYARADCCLVTPLIDGMNLVAKEFIAAKDPEARKLGAVPGAIVLSEGAGAVQELFDALVVNPYDEDAVADAIMIGLELVKGDILDEEQRWEVTEPMRRAIIENDAVAWARSLLTELQAPPEPGLARPESLRMEVLNDGAATTFFESGPGTKALFLDYDGTLRGFEKRAEDATPGEDLLELMGGLAARQDLRVYLVSGRDKGFLEEHFGGFKEFTLIAEHGFMMRGPETKHEWEFFNPYTSTDWMSKIRPVMDLFSRCTPGSRVEEKSSAIVWHFRECDEEYGPWKANELTHQLALSLGNMPCQIQQGHKIVEVASLQVKKGLIVKSTCQLREKSGDPFSAIICIGDDRTDETMFLDAPSGTFTVKVGHGESCARYRLKDPEAVRRFLRIVVDQQVPFAQNSGKARGHHVRAEDFGSCEKEVDKLAQTLTKEAEPGEENKPELPGQVGVCRIPKFVQRAMDNFTDGASPADRYMSVDDRSPDPAEHDSAGKGGGGGSFGNGSGGEVSVNDVSVSEMDPLDELPEQEYTST